MDAERSLIAKAAHTGQVEMLMAKGVNEGHFLDPELVEIWEFMASHARKYKSAPSFAVVKEKFPSHNFEVVTDSLEYVHDRFIDEVMRRNTITELRALAEHVDNVGVSGIDALFMESARRLSLTVDTEKVGRFSDMRARIDEYDRRKEKGAAMGIRMGIPIFDQATLGIQPHEYVSVVGWQGTGKSTLVQWLMFNAWAQGKTCMIISLEMEIEALYRKWDTMITNFEYHALKAMELDDEDRERWEKAAERVANEKCDIIAISDIAHCTVDHVYAKTVKYQPDLVAVDYITLMDTSRSVGQSLWEKVTYITQALKQQTRNLNVPMIGVAQTNIDSADQGAALQNIAYSRSIGQDSDLVIGLHQNEKMRDEQQMEARLLKNRDGSIKNTHLLWDMEHMYFRPWNEVQDIFNRPGADHGEDEAVATAFDAKAGDEG